MRSTARFRRQRRRWAGRRRTMKSSVGWYGARKGGWGCASHDLGLPLLPTTIKPVVVCYVGRGIEKLRKSIKPDKRRPGTFSRRDVMQGLAAFYLLFWQPCKFRRRCAPNSHTQTDQSG